MSPQLKMMNSPKTEQNSKFVPIFEWFERELLDDIKTVSNDFWGVDHGFKLTAFSINQTPLLGDNDYFVTQMKMTNDVIFFVRISKNSIQHFLNKSLGEIDYLEGFEFNQITNLEGTIITAYSNVIYSRLKKLVIKESAQQIEEFDEDYDSGFCHFTFYTTFKEDKGSLIISLPYKILPALESAKKRKEPLPLEHFEHSPITTDVCVGSTKISVDDIKSLEKEDIVVLENSQINQVKIGVLGDKFFEVSSSRDLKLDLDDDNEEDNRQGGMSMGIQSQNDVWDGIQVDVQAQFEKVKLTMGELRQLSEGLIIDVAPVFSNQITLAIEDMPIAKGELVIIEDNYAVRLTEILKQEPKPKAKSVPAIEEKQTVQPSAELDDDDDDDDDDFDYEAFDIDDDEI